MHVQSEWLDLKEEDRVGRVRWEDKAMSTHIRHEAKAKGAPPPFEPDALRGAPPPKGQEALGWRVGIWWRDDAAYYYGMIEEFDSESGVRSAAVCIMSLESSLCLLRRASLSLWLRSIV